MTPPCRGVWYDPLCVEHTLCRLALRVPGTELAHCSGSLPANTAELLAMACQCGEPGGGDYRVCEVRL